MARHREGAVVTITQRFDNSQKWNIALVVPGEEPEYHPPIKAALNPYAPIIDQVLKLAIQYAKREGLRFDIEEARIRYAYTSIDFVHLRYEAVMCEMGLEMELYAEQMKRAGGPTTYFCPEELEAIENEPIGEEFSRVPFFY